MPEQFPSAGLRRLASELRRLRENAGLTQDQVVAGTGIGKASLFRMENGRTRPHKQTLMHLLNFYSADDALREHLLHVYKQARDAPGWLTRFHDVLPGEYSAVIQFQNEARAIRQYESLYIPGLLQTPEYARAVILPGVPRQSDEEVGRRVEARITRQQMLHGENGPELFFVLDEAAIRRKAGGRTTMRKQLQRLLEEADLPNVTLRVIPFDAGAHVGMPGSFMVLEFPAPIRPVVYLDSANGDVVLDNPHDADLYAEMFADLEKIALSPKRSLELIREASSS